MLTKSPRQATSCRAGSGGLCQPPGEQKSGLIQAFQKRSRETRLFALKMRPTFTAR
jgi:hypothetical protein